MKYLKKLFENKELTKEENRTKTLDMIIDISEPLIHEP